MLNQTIEIFNTEAFLTMGMLVFISALMILFYVKWRMFVPMLVIELFTLIMCIQALAVPDIPLTPYFQFLILLLNTVLFTKVSFDVYNKSRG